MPLNSDDQVEQSLKMLAHFILSYTEYSFAIPMIVGVGFIMMMDLVALIMWMAHTGTGTDLVGQTFDLLKPFLMLIFPDGIHFDYEGVSLIEPFLFIAFVLTILGSITSEILRRFGIIIRIGFIKKAIFVFSFLTVSYLFLLFVMTGIEEGEGDFLGWALVLGLFYAFAIVSSLVSLTVSQVIGWIRMIVDEPDAFKKRIAMRFGKLRV